MAPSTSGPFFGTDEAVYQYLEGIFATARFRVVGHQIEVDLPQVGKDGLPRQGGATQRIRFSAPNEWTIQAPPDGEVWHVVPGGSDCTLCTIPLASWDGPPRVDLEHPV